MWLKLLKNRGLLLLLVGGLFANASFPSHPILSHSSWKSFELYKDTVLIDTSRVLSVLEIFSDLPQHRVDSLTYVIKRNYDKGLWRFHFTQDDFKLVTPEDSISGSFALLNDTLYLTPTVPIQGTLKFYVPSISSGHMVLRQPFLASDTLQHFYEVRFYRIAHH